MADEQSRMSFLSNNVYFYLEDQDRLWRQVLLREAWRRRMIGLQLLHHHLPPPSRPPPRRRQVDYSGLTSFLEEDRSFFSPWNWSPNSPQDRDNSGRNERMIFQPDSFFSFDQELFSRMSGKEVGI